MKEKKMAIVCFTPQGQVLAEKIQNIWPEDALDAKWSIEFIYKPVPFKVWMKEHFQELDVLVFIGAMGIVVRDMAPCLKTKLVDPAVVVLDEKGQFVISVLSGHIGGGNAFTLELARILEATPVVTTSSDVNGKIAIDLFAQKNNLVIASMKQAKLCASEIVSGRQVAFLCDGKVHGNPPKELCGSENSFKVIVSPKKQQPEDGVLHLIPKAHVLGIGCRKGTSQEIIQARVLEELNDLGIDIRSIKAMASIDIKSDEEGIIGFAEKFKIPVSFYSGEELAGLEGDFTPSEFVASVTGVENVCERAAFMLATENCVKDHSKPTLADCMVLPKSGKDGVTVSIMKTDWSVRFE